VTVRIEHWRYSIPLWLRGVFRRRDVEREIDDEIRDHIERQTSRNVAAGMPFDEARRAALVAFGGVERVKDESRDVRRLSVVDSVGQLRYAARSLWRARSFAVAGVTTVALAVAAGCAVVTVVRAVLLRPLPYPESDRLVGLWHTAPGIGLSILEQSTGTYLSYRKSAQSFESIGAYGGGIATVTYADPTLAPERVSVSWVTASLLQTLRVRPLRGRLFTDADEQGDTHLVALLSEGFWRTRLGANPNVIGRTLRVDGILTQILGVLPASFAFPGSDVRLWVTFTIPPSQYLGSFNFRAIGRLRPGVSPAAAQRELQQILMRTPETYAEQRPGLPTATVLASTRAAAVVHPLRDDAIGGVARILWLVAATMGMLVLVAFGNVASLTLARVESRQRELAVRTTLGASRARVWSSLATESAIVSVVGGAIGVAIGLAVLAYLARLGPTVMPEPNVGGNGQIILPRLNEIHPDSTFALAALALVAAFGVVSAWIGAWRLTAMDTARLLREGGRGSTTSRASQRLRSAFVAMEVALSLVLLSGCAVLVRSLMSLRAIEPGFDAANVITLWTSAPPWRYRTTIDVSRFYRDALDAVRGVPGVEHVGVVSKLPLSGWWAATPLSAEDDARPAGTLPALIADGSVGGDYFGAMRIPLVAGRVFDESAVRRGAQEAIVTRGVARLYWNDSTGQRALGKRIRKDVRDPWYTIVGVVGDVRDSALTSAATSAVYFPEETGSDSTLVFPRGVRDMAFVVRTRGPDARATTDVRKAIHALDPSVPVYDVASMTERVARAGRRVTVVLLLLGAGALATLALGVVGLYGVITYVVSLRSREIGIRIAIGLAPERATRMLLGQGTAIVVVGAVIGVGAFLVFARLLTDLVFGVPVVDRAAIAAASSIVFAVAMLATWRPARRAARVDLMTALKAES
jgi:putative ABC transport system permease protein